MDACFGPDANVTAEADAEAMFRSLTFRGRQHVSASEAIRFTLHRKLAASGWLNPDTNRAVAA
jgi:hypothetical protein